MGSIRFSIAEEEGDVFRLDVQQLDFCASQWMDVFIDGKLEGFQAVPCPQCEDRQGLEFHLGLLFTFLSDRLRLRYLPLDLQGALYRKFLPESPPNCPYRGRFRGRFRIGYERTLPRISLHINRTIKTKPAAADEETVVKVVDAAAAEVSSLPPCAICLEDLTTCSESGVPTSSSLLRLPCKHVFHDGCMRKWLHIRPTCPYCRFKLLDPPHRR